ncbi:MAG TPA: chloride channel protein [Gammaproteobacteria bacterium]|jgi:H+/Cl- antiporter ClcA|nr:chloride channel protein [Gammaproteobacteria bacterium]
MTLEPVSRLVLRVPKRLGDFDTPPRILLICLLALPVGFVAALMADALLKLIGFITNAIFYQRIATGLVAPGAGHDAWWIVLAAPIIGGLIVGVMARYGSEAIRGHGMPEAIEAILRGGSRIEPRVALLKPVSAAITIGTGGPFGAEGPIIMTGGAFGSLLAQTLKLTADERKTLLVAGAAAGMAATFNAPLASILLAVELLLFEFRPRSFVPVSVAVVVATAMRWVLLGSLPLFPTAHALPPLVFPELLLCAMAGVVGGIIAWAATSLVYLSEDMFRALPIHWMWWPAIGGLIIGVGGLFEPRALGVGYDVIGTLLAGKATLGLIVGILVVKTAIWSLSLGSGTSGGVLAPVFMIGAALGSLLAYIFPPVAPGFWALMSLAAVVGGVMRSPLTGVVFAMELTHQWDAVVPLVIASTAAYLLSVLVLKRSVLTEKVVRRGTHLTREYSVDPLEVFLIGEIMPRNSVSFRLGTALSAAAKAAAGTSVDPVERRLYHTQRLYPVLDESNNLAGIITQHQLFNSILQQGQSSTMPIDQIMERKMVVGYPDMTLREAVNLMAASGISSLPVVDRKESGKVLSVVAMDQILEARLRDVDEERKAERVLKLPAIFVLGTGWFLRRRRNGNAPMPK